MIAKGILTGKITNDYKALDGLKAWAVILLLFARNVPQPKSGIVLKPFFSVNGNDDSIVKLSKKLIELQDLRNPAAHRQTVLQFDFVKQVRTEAFSLLNSIYKIF